ERELGVGQLVEFVDVVLVGDEAAAVVGLLLEEVESGDLERPDLDHEGVEAFVFAAVEAVGERGHGGQGRGRGEWSSRKVMGPEPDVACGEGRSVSGRGGVRSLSREDMQ